jgi:hypothetical protein
VCFLFKSSLGTDTSPVMQNKGWHTVGAQ